MHLGYRTLGASPESAKKHIVVLHDWFCDSSSYEPAIPYLNLESHCYYFMDLRGYGKSIDLTGEYSAQEAAEDVLETVSKIGLSSYHLVGYSMTGLVGQLICALDEKHVHSFTAVCPVSARGLPETPEEVLAFMLDAAKDDDEKAMAAAHMMTSNQHSDAFAHYKVKRWRETSTPEARMGYCRMFVKTDIQDQVVGLTMPATVVCTEFDQENHHESVLKEPFSKAFQKVSFMQLPSAGHYPMQETPVSFADMLNHRFEAR